MKYLTQDQVVNLNKVITAKTGGFSGKVRDNMSFWTAYFSPYAGAFNEEIYKSDIEKILERVILLLLIILSLMVTKE